MPTYTLINEDYHPIISTRDIYSAVRLIRVVDDVTHVHTEDETGVLDLDVYDWFATVYQLARDWSAGSGEGLGCYSLQCYMGSMSRNMGEVELPDDSALLEEMLLDVFQYDKINMIDNTTFNQEVYN